MSKLDELPTTANSNVYTDGNDLMTESSAFGVYEYGGSIFLYDDTGIHNLNGEGIPSSKTLLEEGNKLDYDKLDQLVKEKILEIHKMTVGISYTRDEIYPMLYPDSLEKNFILLVNENKEFTEAEKESIKEALSFMKDTHRNQFRDEGLPYYVHPLKVAYNILKNGGTYEEIVCGLLHDVVEDNENIDINTLYNVFGNSIVDVIFTLSKKIGDGEKKEETIYLENVANNQIAKKVKGYDRLNNIASTYFIVGEKKEKYIKETEDIYVPFFERYNPEIAEKVKEILKYIKTNPQPTEKELQLINQIHDSCILVNKIIE